MSDYKPENYWRERGESYKDEFKSKNRNPVQKAKYETQGRLLIELLGRLSFKSVLEIGCGFGRITKLMVDAFPAIESFDALDLSPDQLKNAKEYVNSAKVTYHCTTFQAFTAQENTYDLVVASEVLLHVQPIEIKTFMARMIALSRANVVHIDWSPRTPPTRPAAHNFPHNYPQIYRELGSKIRGLEVIRVRGRVLAILPTDFDQDIYHASL